MEVLEPKRVNSKAFRKALQIADTQGFRPSNPVWRAWQEATAQREGLRPEDFEWYEMYPGIHHFSSEESSELASVLARSSPAATIQADVGATIATLISLGQQGAIEWGFSGRALYVGPTGSVIDKLALD